MCEYCNKKVNNKKIEDVDNDVESLAEVVMMATIDDSIRYALHIELDGLDEDGYKTSDYFEINYCPMCGKKLGE